MGRLADKTAVITGGASGIGRAAAERFRAEGVERLADRARERFDRVDILFANAGIGVYRASTTMSEDDWDRTFDVDVKGLWLMCRAFLPGMIERGSGVIVLTASQLGLVGYADLAAYAAAKAAAINLARSLAAQAGVHGVRVNALCPGPTLTPLLEDLFEQAGDPQVRERLAASTLLGRFASPAEIASAALFLASEDASYVTGAALVADGGYTAV
jgi:NAD(P)-dependent dehydrogenase (short-subunit alcohol dehydrogenase family)